MSARLGLIIASTVVTGTLALTVFTSFAEARPSTRSYTCEGARAFVASKGAVVMNTKNANVYRRFVRGYAQCRRDEVVEPFAVPVRGGRCTLRICRPKPDRFPLLRRD